mgnify:CR=1 FL=1
MKKRSLLLILLLTLSLATPIFISLTQTQPVYTQSIITPTKTYQINEALSTTPPIQINFTVVTSIGVLIEGNVAGISINIGATCYTPNATNANVTGIIINSDSQISTAIMIPLSKAFESNTNMSILTFNEVLNITSLALNSPRLETVLLLSDTVGFPGLVSFNISATVETTNGSETVYLTSNTGPAISFVLPNPGKTPQIINFYNYSSLLLVFLLPITLIVTHSWLKTHRVKKESVEGV